MVFNVGQKALECLFGYSRGACYVHVPAMRAGATATHVSPVVLGVQVQQTGLMPFSLSMQDMMVPLATDLCLLALQQINDD